MEDISSDQPGKSSKETFQSWIIGYIELHWVTVNTAHFSREGEEGERYGMVNIDQKTLH